MMKKIELFWNIVYYGIYKFDVFLRKLLGFFNPINLINKINRVKNFHLANGVTDINEVRNSIFNSPRNGISSVRTGAFMGGVLVLIEIGIFNIFQAFTGNYLELNLLNIPAFSIVFLLVFIVPAVLINHQLLFKNDKYIYYLNKFEKLELRKKRSYFLWSLISILLIVSFFFSSFLTL